ncbi:molybdopterin molybdotransferase MoeA [Dokdonella sp. MW10]|uniref:molybdopterin molybdotransferase MoeA n=1 Tax=Dokdonella sp. MW10 TaxID=2992926 RepID=UPI003F7F73E6
MNDIPTFLSVPEAQAAILACCTGRVLDAEPVALHRAAARVLRADFVAGADVPAFANSAMDGFAVASADLPSEGERRLRIADTRFAGDTREARIAAGEALRITTGAPLPAGADTVVIKERVRVDGNDVVLPGGEVAGANVRPAGEDYRRGDVALRAGERLGAAQLGVLASLGHASIDVARRPRVAVVTTGDELVLPGEPLGHAQIHNSNGFSLAALLERSGAELVSPTSSALPFDHVRDDPDRLATALRAAAATSDVVVTSGGVSAGEADFLPQLLAAHGRVHFWKVRMRPGMPVLFGELDGALVFGLPGNPVSSYATLLMFVAPALAALQGAREVQPRTWHARLAAPIAKRHDRTEFMRARLASRADGSLWATPVAKQGSGMLRGVADADALIVVPEEARMLETGTVVATLPLPERS